MQAWVNPTHNLWVVWTGVNVDFKSTNGLFPQGWAQKLLNETFKQMYKAPTLHGSKTPMMTLNYLY